MLAGNVDADASYPDADPDANLKTSYADADTDLCIRIMSLYCVYSLITKLIPLQLAV